MSDPAPQLLDHYFDVQVYLLKYLVQVCHQRRRCHSRWVLVWMVPWSTSWGLFCMTSKQPGTLSVCLSNCCLMRHVLIFIRVVASSTIIIYDHGTLLFRDKWEYCWQFRTVSTLDQEVSSHLQTSLGFIIINYQVELIWMAPWTLGKILFLIVRIDSTRQPETSYAFYASRIVTIRWQLSCVFRPFILKCDSALKLIAL